MTLVFEQENGTQINTDYADFYEKNERSIP
jgi:hypothetical protein